MIHTLHITDLEKHADNVYEAIIVIAKKARGINLEQKEAFLREREEFDDEEIENYEDEEVMPIAARKEYVRLTKPTTLALQQFLDGKLEFTYRKPAEEQEESNS